MLLVDGNQVLMEYIRTPPTPLEHPLLGVIRDYMNYDYPVVWVFDGRGGLAWRREFYPDYKIQRRKAQSTFPWEVLNRGIEAIQDCSKFFTIRVDGFEGDDVLAHLAARYNRPGRRIRIHSTDQDLLRLEAFPGVELPNVPKDAPLRKIPRKYLLAYKSTVGDPSDNIKGIPGFGPKAWEDHSPARITAWFQYTDRNPVTFPSESERILNAVRDNHQMICNGWKCVQFRDIDHAQVDACTSRGTKAPLQVIDELIAEGVIDHANASK